MRSFAASLRFRFPVNISPRRLLTAALLAALGTLLLVTLVLAAAPIVSYFEPTPVLGSEFGTSVIGMNDWVIVGAPKRNTGRFDTEIGRVFVYQEADSWHRFTIDNPNPANGDRFGYALAPFYTANPTKFIVGTPFDDDVARDAGIVYIYSASSGGRIRTIHNPDSDIGDLFGSSVAFVLPNLILVGTPGENGGRGIAYLFDANTGALVRTLENPDPDADDAFGETVFGGGTAVVAAPEDDLGGNDAGTVYVFDPANGNRLQTLENPAPARGGGGSDAFGAALGEYLDANFATQIVVGAPGEDAGGTDIGAAYIFNGGTGDRTRTLDNPDPDNDDVFGTAVSASTPKHVVVSAKYDDTKAQNAGAAYLFDASNGNLLRTFYSQNFHAGDELGNDVALGEAGFLVGVYRDDTADSNGGAVYLFQPVAGPEISIHGSHFIIRKGDTSPTASDGTYFGHTAVNGGRVTHTFTIRNIGSSALNLTGTPRVQLSGNAASSFSVVLQPSASIASAGGTSNFQIRFDPSTTGATQIATVTVKNNDSSEATYKFSISGIGDP